jgi:hypothetical protein
LFDWVQEWFYESPHVVALGPEWSAVFAGFAVIVNGEFHMTPAGERYLERIDRYAKAQEILAWSTRTT